MKGKRIAAIGLVVLVGLGAAGFGYRDELGRLRATMTLFDEGEIVDNFSHMDRLFETVPIPVTTRAEPLPEGPAMEMPAEWQDWLDRRAVTGAIVLRNGEVVHESYHLGTGAEDLRISWSVAKSYLSALFGILVAQGHVDSLDDPVVKYAPQLKSSAYEGATIRNVLQMSTGVVFDEDYLDFWSDINEMGRILALGGSMDGFAAGLTETDQPPGERWRYVSIDTHVLSMVARGATGKQLPDLLAENLLDPMGTYGKPYYLSDGYDVAFALGGLNLMLRDYARLGEMFRDGGRLQGKQIVPEDWVIESTTPSARTAPGRLQYGYQWWMPSDARDGEFMARGIYGQYVYVDRQSGTVVAVTGADRRFREAGAFDDALQMFRRLAGL
ncbi:serine hydrolase [Mameliella sp. AT18]|uniref:serine hydrolase domain-containing protein n=1 Tax=Mameliella sp. AT18 TaxID=3028385 RepID=UPI000841052A|nr:serine hydrolase [Mameliella sp. AT18]MDD9729674.1 serine hydrolase [Mameliella sp. AT18]ODM48010.1 6-aminohexanoate hydrolase [Ruegeria sp. PBVC088]